MKILLHSPAATIRRTGNRQTSATWVTMLRDLGHEIEITFDYEVESADLLIALHAVKSHETALRFRRNNPDGKLILALTGTDIYPDPSETAIDTMEAADRIITLQRKAIRQLPSHLQEKTHLVIQSSEPIVARAELGDSRFRVAVVGHLRDVKDPLLTARAARLLSSDSQIEVVHVGGILEEKYSRLVAREEKQNPRYTWLGELSEMDTAEILASSDLLVVSSHSEGGARVVGEAIVHGCPILSTAIDGVTGLLGDDYLGLYPVGDAEALSAHLHLCETDSGFYQALRKQAIAHAAQFAPAQEKAALEEVIGQTC